MTTGFQEDVRIVSMKQVLRKVASCLSVALLAVLTFGIHASALLPQASHVVGGMNHSASSSSSCITICTLATFHKDDYLNEADENDEDEPQTPFYAQFQSSPLVALEKEHGRETRLAIEREPPPGGLPAYIALTVFRA